MLNRRFERFYVIVFIYRYVYNNNFEKLEELRLYISISFYFLLFPINSSADFKTIDNTGPRYYYIKSL